MKKLPFLLLVGGFLLAVCCLLFSCKPKNGCCDLPAPDSLTATVLDSTSAKLEWSPVTGAAAYRITVKDISSNTTLPLITMTGTDTTLASLTPNHDYTAIVQAVCGSEKPCTVSSNGAAACWSNRGVIVVDEVVMREYNNDLESYCPAYGSASTLLPTSGYIPVNYGGGTQVIYQFEVRISNGSLRYFKLAYDSNCPNKIKGFICPQQDVSLTKPANTTNVVELKEGASVFATLTATSSGINVAVASTSCNNTCVRYRVFAGTEPWVGGCQ